MKTKKHLSLLYLLFVAYAIPNAHSQANFRTMFYNVENLFDTEDSPNTNDADFLPEGSKRWTYGRYKTKIENISKVISSVGEWGSPALIGLCEVENDKVMTDLTKYSSLKSQGYKYIITQSLDRRGINVALMYQRDQFKLLAHNAYRLPFPARSQKRSRDVLHVSGQLMSGDTLDVFVCHFPSRRGGEQRSEPDRLLAASLVKSKVDSLMRKRRNCNILIMGDFNDEPSNKSMRVALDAKPIKGKPESKSLYNLFYGFEKPEDKGSYKFRAQWNVLDQMIVSGNLLDRKRLFFVRPETAEIYSRSFLLTDDKSNGGKRPKKSYHGMKYEAGFSDHLPIIVDFSVKTKAN